MDEEDRSAEEAKRRVILWGLSALSGIAGTVALSLGYWLVSVAIEARDHVRTPHFTRMDHMEYDQAVKLRFADLPPQSVKDQIRRLEDDMKAMNTRVQRLERGKGE